MAIAAVIEVIDAVVALLHRFVKGDQHATRTLKEILPDHTYTRLVREREKALDQAKFGG